VEKQTDTQTNGGKNPTPSTARVIRSWFWRTQQSSSTQLVRHV